MTMKNKIEEAAREYLTNPLAKWSQESSVGAGYGFIAGASFVLSELMPRVEELVRALEKCSDIECWDADSISAEALAEWREFYATLDGIEGEKK